MITCVTVAANWGCTCIEVMKLSMKVNLHGHERTCNIHVCETHVGKKLNKGHVSGKL